MRVAVLLQGGIGAGNFSQGCPPLVNLVTKLSADHQITVYSIFPANADFHPQGFVFRTIHPRIYPLKIRTVLIFFLFLWDHLRTPYDLIHAFWVYPAGTMAVILSKLVRTPTIVSVHGGEAAALPQLGYGNMLKPWLKKITLWTCEQATHLNFISNFLANEMRRHGLKRNDISVIHLGPEKTIFTKSDKSRNGLLRIIHVGNLTGVKDQAMLLKAFQLVLEELPAALRIIGDGTLGDEIYELCEKMNLLDHVKLMGAIPNKALPEQYEWADVMMHSSLHEGLPNVVVEAMYSGVVVCGTRVGILFDLGDQYFETVEVGDYQSLASSVVRVCNDKSRYKALKENAFNWIQTRDAAWTAKEFNDLYKKVKQSSK